MELQFYGANCVTIQTKRARIVIDDNLADIGGKSIAKPDDIILSTDVTKPPKVSAKLAINSPGEYEVSDISITGMSARAHVDESSGHGVVMYKLDINDIRVLVVGHIYPELTNKQLEQIGIVDILIVPVGGHGLTLDPTGALQVIKKIEPPIIIPTHYQDAVLSYPMPQTSLDEAVQELGLPITEKTSKYKVKVVDRTMPQALVVLEKAK